MSNRTTASALRTPTARHAPSHSERTPQHGPAPSGLDGIGDIVDAGRPSGYAHLAAAPRTAPTAGRLAAAADSAADALRRTPAPADRSGHWRPAPRPVRRGASGRMRISSATLAPDGSTALPPAPSGSATALRLVSGRAHVLSAGPGGELRSVRELLPGRTLLLAAGTGNWLVNTGAEAAVAVRATA
ncbi:hypothetical protein [Nocardiopsis potens]|uniref:hypothetical protein n=1 Tax=Nocardiopsis potens TaxID=1246458 RepID=UPI00036C425F|nr:hypothetical protein [Nocardiopsis potens]